LPQDAGRTRDDVVRWAGTLYSDHVDHKDADGFAAVFTPDATLRFGNSDALTGRDAIRDAIAQFFTAFKSLRHHSGRTWIEGDIVVLGAVVTYIRHDGKEVTVPAVTIFHLIPINASSTPLADECRIYVDLAPLFAA